MICVDYNYYIKTYGGVEMPPSKFNALELRATKHINKITSNRIDFENIDSLGEEIEENIIGDINDDGVVSAVDMSTLIRYILCDEETIINKWR